MDNSLPLPGETEEQRDIRVNKDVAAFSYVWIMSLVIFYTRKDSRFVQYHAKQGIVLFILSIVAPLIPVAGKFLLLIVVGGMLLGFVHAAQGMYSDVPIAGEFAKGKLKVGDVMQSFSQLIQRGMAFFKKQMTPSEPPTTDKKPVDNPPPPPVV
jgi:uncharacterized membrane protein